MSVWKLNEKSALVLGDNMICDTIKSALISEGVTICSDTAQRCDILITVPKKINSGHQNDITISNRRWRASMNELFEETRELTHKVVSRMQTQKSGRIIHVIGSHEPSTFNVEYAAWGALAAWAKSLTRAVGKDGISINLVQAGIFSGHPHESHVPIGRPCQPYDIANLIVFLCSEYSKYINGAIIPVDGGLSRFQH